MRLANSVLIETDDGTAGLTDEHRVYFVFVIESKGVRHVRV
jgi:hypothetical protein